MATATHPATLACAPARARIAWPSLVETLLTLVAVAAILPWFARFGDDPDGRDRRFASPPGSPAIVRAAPSAGPSTDPKDDAMRTLLVQGGLQWAGWMVAGLALVKLARTRAAPSLGVALACATWALAAWIGRVPWPLAHDRAFEPGRVASAWDSPPATFVAVLAGIAVVLLVALPWRTARRAGVAQTLASRIGYPGFVVATGLGWLLLLDLSANGPAANRYLALYHHGHLWLAMLALTVLAFLRASLANVLAWLLAVVEELRIRVGSLLGPRLAPALAAFVAVVAVVATAWLLSGIRQVTSELGRIWLIVGVAWFFFLRGGAVAQRIAMRGTTLGSLVRYSAPLAFVALVLAGAMIATRDMGPLLIAAYAAGAFVAAAAAMEWHIRSGAVRAPLLLAVALFVAWIVAITLALFRFGAVDEVAAGRLENLAAPLASANDQLALVTWFRHAAPPEGFGPGSVPWCGFSGAAGCAGVPTQIQSDYTFTALAATFGGWPAWAVVLGGALWLHRLIRHHGRVTRGEPRFVRRGARVVADAQAFVSWIGLAWVVLTLCQLGVTVAGNLGVLPLTGVTFPFVSFGMTSLVVNAAFLALCISVQVPERDDA